MTSCLADACGIVSDCGVQSAVMRYLQRHGERAQGHKIRELRLPHMVGLAGFLTVGSDVGRGNIAVPVDANGSRLALASGGGKRKPLSLLPSQLPHNAIGIDQKGNGAFSQVHRVHGVDLVSFPEAGACSNCLVVSA